MDNVCVITVTWNSAAVLPKLLASIPADAEIVVVDNASTDTSVQIAESFGAKLVHMPENRGFGVANNAGAAMTEREFLFFANPDLVLSPDCLTNLVASITQNTTLSAINPLIKNEDGSVSYRRKSVLLHRKDFGQKSMAGRSGVTPVLSGCAVFVRRELFAALGGFDPQIFLYHEDDDLSMRLKAHGDLYVESQAVVTHAAGTGSPRTHSTARFKAFEMAKSKRYVIAKYDLRVKKIHFWLEVVGKMLNPANLVSGRKRAQALGFLRGAFSST